VTSKAIVDGANGKFVNPWLKLLMLRSGEWDKKDPWRMSLLPPRIAANREKRNIKEAPRPHRTLGPTTPETIPIKHTESK